MEANGAKRVHIGNNLVRCRVTTSYSGWYEQRTKLSAAGKPIPEDIKGIEHFITYDYSGMTLENAQKSSAKGDVIKTQGVITKNLKNEEDFVAFLTGDGADLVIPYRDAGNVEALRTPEQKQREDMRAASQLSLDDLQAIIAERMAEQDRLTVMEDITTEEVEKALQELDEG